jgi:hypothetical protein
MFCKSRDIYLYMEIILRFVYASFPLFLYPHLALSVSEAVSCNSFPRILKPCLAAFGFISEQGPKKEYWTGTGISLFYIYILSFAQNP